MYICIYIYTYIYMHIFVYIYMYTARKASWNIEGVEPGDQEGPG